MDTLREKLTALNTSESQQSLECKVTPMILTLYIYIYPSHQDPQTLQYIIYIYIITEEQLFYPIFLVDEPIFLVDELRCLPKVDAYRSKLEKRHDELADLKSYFDGHMKASDGEEQFDKANLVIFNRIIHW